MPTVPVLLITFRRPEVVRLCIDALRRIRPPVIVHASDGPRTAPEAELVALCRRAVAEQIDWPCEVVRDFSETNLGCRRRVTSAIDHVLENHDRVIVLEEDCVISDSFYPFASDMLDRYEHDARIGAISAMSHGANQLDSGASYRFSAFLLCWGWATWRRAWRFYDESMPEWQRLRRGRWLRDLHGGSRLAQWAWRRKFDKAFGSPDHIWDYQWMYSLMRNSMLTIHPSVNMVSNIGFGPDSTNTALPGDPLEARPRFDLRHPLAHPAHVMRDFEADRHTQRSFFQPSPVTFLRRRMRMPS